ncbi:hypothetical protein BLM37_03630 [Candidatus Gracilibacteria bacterium GN02-873]|nr:hypothetical protein BLM37_03630 [Candidatus Gracilibacteria bacterium GN02-873]
MELSFCSDCDDFLSIFKEISKVNLDDHGEKWLKIFMLQINSKDFDYENLKKKLEDPLLGYTLSRHTIKTHSGGSMSISKKARDKIRDYQTNTGELGEYLLYCFLETDLKAPKILSKIELKTAPNNYVNGSDGVHFQKIQDNYILLFGESKTIKNIKTGITKALSSIYDFKNGIKRDDSGKEIDRNSAKFGMGYEITLISDNLLKETFNKEDEEFLKAILYPTKNSSFRVDNGFAVFIGFEINLKKLQTLSNEDFYKELEDLLKEKINENIDDIKKLINEKDLLGHNIYFYFFPFSNLDQNRKDIIKHIIT